MKQANWIAQNDETDEDGFFTNSFDAERAALAEMGCPDTDRIEFEYILPVDRDEAECLAMVTEATWNWLLKEEMIYEDGGIQ